jgi:hypothetical protein
LNQAKKTELHKTLEVKELDTFCIFKANVTEETIKYFHFKNYHLNFLPKLRKIASGILIGTHKPPKHIFSIVKKMNSVDKTEIIKLNVPKNEKHVKVFGIYNPPQNNPALSLLDVTKRTLIVDFNPHFHDVGYKNINEAGKMIEDFLSANNVELLHEKKDPPTYLHYNGSTINPDLTLASPDIAALASRNIIDDPGCGHRMIITTVNFKTTSRTFNNNLQYVWNFKKAKWNKYRKELDSKISK